MHYKTIIFLVIFSLFQTSSTPVQFTVPGIDVSPSNTVELPVRIQANGNNVGSLEFELNYDSSILEFSQISISERAQQWMTYTMDTGHGRVRWGGYDASHGKYSINAPTEIFTVTFKVLNANWATTPITIGRKRAGDSKGWDIPIKNTDGYMNMMRRASTDVPADGIAGKIYPVPTADIINVELNLSYPGTYRVSLYTMNGDLIKSRVVNLETGKNYLQEDLRGITEGLYLLHIAGNNFVRSFKLIKK